MTDELAELKQQMLELQRQLALQEDALRSLDHAVSHQQQEIMLLRRQLQLMQQRQREQAAQHAASPSVAVHDEKPPHY